MEAKKLFRDALCMPKMPKVVKPKVVDEEVNKNRNFNKDKFSYESIQIGKYYVVKTRDDDDWQEDVDFLMKCTDKKDGVIYYSININPRCTGPGVEYSPIYSGFKFSDGKITPLPVDYWTNKSKYNIKPYYWHDDDDF